MLLYMLQDFNSKCTARERAKMCCKKIIIIVIPLPPGKNEEESLTISRSCTHPRPHSALSSAVCSRDVVVEAKCLLRRANETHFAIVDSWLLSLALLASSRLALAVFLRMTTCEERE